MELFMKVPKSEAMYSLFYSVFNITFSDNQWFYLHISFFSNFIFDFEGNDKIHKKK